jgi:hypothetical protein
VIHSAGERTGVLVLRVWIEYDGGGGLRARITESSDILSYEQTTVVVGSIEDVLGVVRDWLDAFVHTRDGPVTDT